MGPYDIQSFDDPALQMLTQGSPFFSPPKPFTPYEPFAAIQTGNPLMDMALRFGANWAQTEFGGLPFGFGNMLGGNLAGNMRAQAFSNEHMRLLARASAMDVAPVMDLYRGAQSLGGFRGGNAEVEAFVRAGLANPSLAPGLMGGLDFLTGGRAFGMSTASAIHMAGRNQLDPTTGRLGMSAETAFNLTDRLRSDLGFDDPNTWRTRTMGFSGSEVGTLYRELAQRGQMPTATSDTDTTRIKSTLQTNLRMLEAVKEIFNDSDIHGATIPQLLAAAQSLTGNMRYQVAPGQLESNLRQLREAMKTGDTSLAQAMQMSLRVNATAAQLGITPGITPTEIGLDMLNYKNAMPMMGGLATPVWGEASPDALIAMRGDLMIRNAASPLANQMGLISRLNQLTGGRNAGLSAMVAEISAGGLPAALSGRSEQEIMEYLAKTSGLDLSQVESMNRQKRFNEEAGAALGPGRHRATAGESLREYRDKVLGIAVRDESLSEAMRVLGTGAASRGVGGIFQSQFRDFFSGLTSEQLADKTKLSQDFAGRLRGGLEAAAAAGDTNARRYLDSLSSGAGGLDQGLVVAANRILGAAEDRGRMVDAIRLLGPEADKATAAQAARTRARGVLGGMTAHIHDPAWYSRVSAAVQAAGTDPSRSDVSSVVKSALGISDPAVIREIAAAFTSMEQRTDELASRATAITDEVFKYNPSDPRSEVDQRKAWEAGKKTRLAEVVRETEALNSEKNRWSQTIDARPDVKEAIDREMKAAKGEDAESSSGPSSGKVTLHVENLNINGVPVVTNASGETQFHSGRNQTSTPKPVA